MLELYLDNNKLDMPEKFEINMNYTQTDLSKPEAKKNNYSKSVTVPGTALNNRIFGNIFRFDTSISSSKSLVGIYFNPNNRIPFVLLNNGEFYDSGYAKLDKINSKNGNVSYQLTLYGYIGSFFFNLMYNEDGEQKTLNDIIWNFTNGNIYNNMYVPGYTLTPEEENNNILFEYNKDFIRKSWQYRNTTLKDDSIFKSIPENDIYKFVCPVPCYNGFYDDFDSNKVIIDRTNMMGSVYEYDWNTNTSTPSTGYNVLKSIYKNVDGKDNNDYSVYPYTDFILAELDRDVSEFEIGDLRSHYQPYAFRLKGIFDAICNPINNGGFNVNTDNISPVEKKYIENGYVLQDRFDWSEINKDSSTTSDISFNKSKCTASKGVDYALSSNVDISSFINASLVVEVLPSIVPRNMLVTSQEKPPMTQAIVQGGYYKYRAGRQFENYWLTQQVQGAFAQSVQYFFIEVYSSDNTLIKTSDIILYSGKTYDFTNIDDFPEYYVYWTKGDIGDVVQYANISTSFIGKHVITKILQSNGKKIFNNTNKWRDISNEYISYDPDANNTVNILTQYMQPGYGGYVYNGPADLGYEFVKEDQQAIKISIDNINYTGDIHIRLVSGAVSFTSHHNADTSLGTDLNWPGVIYVENPTYQDISDDFKIYNNGYYNSRDIYDPKNDRIYSNKTVEALRLLYANSGEPIAQSDFATFNLHIKSAKVQSGASTSTYTHVVNKYDLFRNSSSPYEYLISMAKLFNWKFIYDNISNTVNIYSLNNYFLPNVIDLDVDVSSFDIVPNTATANIYNFTLNKLEESYSENIWNLANKKEYGSLKYNTKYQFNNEAQHIFEDIIFKTSAPYTQQSVYYNIDRGLQDNPMNMPLLGKELKLTLWHHSGIVTPEDSTNSTNLTVYGRLKEGTVRQDIPSPFNYIGCFDREYNHLDMTNMLVFYDSESTKYNGIYDKLESRVNRPATINVTDDFLTIFQMNGNNNCYYYSTYVERNIPVDVDNNITLKNSVGYTETNPPVFRNYFYDIESDFPYNRYFGISTSEVNEPDTLDYKTPNNYNVYELCWKNYIEDLYNKNNKIVTIKCKLPYKPNTAMRYFYTFNNAVWMLNKIIDYNPTDVFTKCEFIQVQDIYNYCGSSSNNVSVLNDTKMRSIRK